ncbi:MAG TPA: hypothetical protein VFV72_00600 [Candidatus Limnocylindrales bacterium]|nr:hypothetical protein [Candidatus Limnocylindrales bacterium]
MFSPAMIVANSKINELQAEAAAQRLAKQSRSARPKSGRTAGALATVRSFFTLAPAAKLPNLSDYPYRS